jgi:acetolactate synthase I/II/III large subunit
MLCDMGSTERIIEGHAGEQTVAALLAHGTDTMFTLNGGHIWPFYDAARNQGMRVIDTRHEQTATFAAEAYAKLTRRPGLAALTAGPGITNGISAITSAWFNGSPLVVLGGRAPELRWGSGSLQEFDHVPVLAPVTKLAATVKDPSQAARLAHEAIMVARSPHRGPVFLDYPLDVFGPSSGELPDVGDDTPLRGPEPDPDEVARLVALIGSAERPAFIVGSDVYWAGAWPELRAAASSTASRASSTDWAGARWPPTTIWRSCARAGCSSPAPTWWWCSALRSTSGWVSGASVTPRWPTWSTPTASAPAMSRCPTVAGDLRVVLRALAEADGTAARRTGWVEELRGAEQRAGEADQALLTAGTAPIKPGRIYGELARRLERDAVIICDGGDFASYAGKLVEVYEPGSWLDTGPYGCLGNGPGYAIAARVVRPSSQIVLLLGDGAAGFSLMDVDTMVRHQLPVVMVVGNNGMWGLEKHPMQAIYGWDLACDLQPGLPYDQVVAALGGAGETVSDPADIGPALDRAFASGVPYLVNVLTDPDDVYPRTSNLA